MQGVAYKHCFKRKLCMLQMRKVANSLYRPCRESLINTVSNQKKTRHVADAESRILPVSPMKVVAYKHCFKRKLCMLQMQKAAYSLYRHCRESPVPYSWCGESPAPSMAGTGSPMPRMVNTESRIAVGDLMSIHWTFKGLPVCFKRQLSKTSRCLLYCSKGFI